MKAVTAGEMREIDRIAIHEKGIPGPVLMSMAGRAVADHVISLGPSMRRIAVIAGPGNNGGDGYVAAYFIHNAGITVDIITVMNGKDHSESALIFRRLCMASGITERPFAEAIAADVSCLDDYDCVVDALLGIGFTGTARGDMADAIQLINDTDVRIVSVDIPSGLGADGAAPEGEAVIADVTVTMGLPKLSLVTYPGKGYAGQVIVADIGFPTSLTRSDSLKAELIDNDFFSENTIRDNESYYLADPDAHKGKRGNLLIVGGFDGMEGAAMLTARAAFETGVGLATLVTTAAAREIIAGSIPELITASIPFGPDGTAPSMEEVEEALNSACGGRRYDVLVIGPGLGRAEFSKRVFDAVIASAGRWGIRKALIDGDGLYHLALMTDKRALDPGIEWAVTPHFKEASRILDLDIDEIARNRPLAAAMIARRLSCAALLKGPASIVSDGERHYINTTGTAALATAGSGDVLSGIIGALMLRKLTAVHAAACGAWIHGEAADLHCAGGHYPVMKSTDMLLRIREARDRLFCGCCP
ncbi:MAG: NAD(P)H-hydrate dehydratase [Chrysiogenales bacterium]|nr:MAG: NAD(P)H-hydrate dehydratase [Chrysiogenales bacterium]